VLHALGPLLVLPKVRTSGFSSTSHVRVTERTELLAIFGVKRLTPQVVGGTTRIIAAVNQKGGGVGTHLPDEAVALPAVFLREGFAGTAKKHPLTRIRRYRAAAKKHSVYGQS
jgi:hypothetical protein